MEQKSFLQQESKKANKKVKKLILLLAFIYCIALAFIVIATKGKVDLNDYDTKKIVMIFGAASVFMLFCMLVAVFKPVDTKGKNISLPFNDNTKEEAARIIDREVSEKKVLVDEYLDIVKEGKESNGERVMLLSSYLLLFNGMGHIVAIPRDKIYWLCAQIGKKGSSSFIVRFLVFTEKKTFYLDGADVKHVMEIAGKLYQYIPNVFGDYISGDAQEAFLFPYKLEKMYEKNRVEFLKFYVEEKKKYLEHNPTLE